ncbi:MAG: phosphate acyltransferase PlsX [Puniceicoccales bacterium]|jgi:glycerol-3-phosphate acyltransferase PlsX|nr:phosphate acyltransferase PlsX [Puniceicoccales bacterium]
MKESPLVSPTYGGVAIDMMGSDLGPEELFDGVRLALKNFSDITPFILVGDGDLLSSLLSKYHLEQHPKLSVFHASQVIEMDDKPIQSLKQKKDASMIRALELIQARAASAVLSCGNTGSLMAGSTLKLRPIPGIERPAMASIIPSSEGYFILADVGANPQSSPMHLAHNALLATVYCQKVLQIASPRVGLLTIGTEEGKGNELIQKAHEKLKQLSAIIHYVGLIEGFHLFSDHVDVVICDGFTGNVLLKSMESLASYLKAFAKKEFLRNPLRAFGALCSRGAFEAIKTKLSSERYGAAPLLGLNGTVFKAHGSSNAKVISYAIHMASEVSRIGIQNDEAELICRAKALLK